MSRATVVPLADFAGEPLDSELQFAVDESFAEAVQKLAPEWTWTRDGLLTVLRAFDERGLLRPILRARLPQTFALYDYQRPFASDADDTLQAGINAHAVSTIATPAGVKANWWEALQQLYAALVPPSFTTRSDRAMVAATSNRYTRAQFAASICAEVEACGDRANKEWLPLRATGFAQRYWHACVSQEAPHARYYHGTESFVLYQQLIRSYTGQSESAVSDEAPLEEHHVLVLAAPVVRSGQSACRVLDPMYPVSIEVPARVRDGVFRLVAMFTARPARAVDALRREWRADEPMEGAVSWMLSQGLLLRSRSGGVSTCDNHFGQGYITTNDIDSKICDLVVLS